MRKLDLSFPDRYKFVCTFLDDHSRYTFLGFLQNLSDIQQAFHLMTSWLNGMISDSNKRSLDYPSVIHLHCDEGKEYETIDMDFKGNGIEKSVSPPYTPKLNAIAERLNRALTEAARSVLIEANLPKCLRPFALKHVIYVRNRVPHSTINTTP